MTCPTCRRPLDRLGVSPFGLDISWCAGCGTRVDERGELRGITVPAYWSDYTRLREAEAERSVLASPSPPHWSILLNFEGPGP